MSGVNTKAQKIDRILSRLTELGVAQLNIDELVQTIFRQQGTVDRLSNSLKLATETANRLEAESSRLRKYLGGELFKRRQRDMQIPTLEPQWGNSGTLEARDPPPICTCPPGECRGSMIGLYRCRHCITPSSRPCRCSIGYCGARLGEALPPTIYCNGGATR